MYVRNDVWKFSMLEQAWHGVSKAKSGHGYIINLGFNCILFELLQDHVARCMCEIFDLVMYQGTYAKIDRSDTRSTHAEMCLL